MRRIGAAALALVPWIALAAEQPGSRFSEGTHYVLTGEEVKDPDGIVVRVFMNFSSELGADFARRLPAWIRGLPENVRVVAEAPPLDQASGSLSMMFYALEHLGRGDLHEHRMYGRDYTAFRPSRRAIREPL